jgi:hypothetical protein
MSSDDHSSPPRTDPAIHDLSRALTVAFGKEQLLLQRIARGTVVVDAQTRQALTVIEAALRDAVQALRQLESR